MFVHLLTLATFTLNIVYAQKPSPCPDVFSYESRDRDQDRWYGVMQLRTPEDLHGVWLHITLDMKVDLLGNWFGEATSTDNIEFTIRNQNYRLEAGPPVSVRFFVKYNSGGNIPSLQSIRLNGKIICSAQQEVTRPTPPTLHISKSSTSTEGSTTRRSSMSSQGTQTRPGSSSIPTSSIGNNRPSSSSGNNNRPSGSSVREPESSRRPSRPVTSSNSGTDDDDDDDDQPISLGNQRPGSITPGSGSQVQCGTVAASPVPLISHGHSTFKGEWPWHVALYYSQGVQLTYTCGGTLISQRHVVTAAHCVTKPHTTRLVNKKYILVYLGKHELSTFGSEVQDKGIEQIYVHPEYDAGVYFNDIAVIKLVSDVQITKYVRPCCLWEEDTTLDYIVGKHGTVVGWGFDENLQLSNSLMQAQMPVISSVKCIFLNREFFSQFLFEKNYCAGYTNETSVCNGDSGGGMVFQKRNSKSGTIAWQLRGIVSLGVALQSRGVCNTTQPSLFTDVAKHLPWIKETISL